MVTGLWMPDHHTHHTECLPQIQLHEISSLKVTLLLALSFLNLSQHDSAHKVRSIQAWLAKADVEEHEFSLLNISAGLRL